MRFNCAIIRSPFQQPGSGRYSARVEEKETPAAATVLRKVQEELSITSLSYHFLWSSHHFGASGFSMGKDRAPHNGSRWPSQSCLGKRSSGSDATHSGIGHKERSR